MEWLLTQTTEAGRKPGVPVLIKRLSVPTCDQISHDGDDGDFGGFSCSAKALVLRDLRRHLDVISAGALRDGVAARLALSCTCCISSLGAATRSMPCTGPRLDCISKDKARIRYEFGCKVSIAATRDEGFIVGKRSFPGNP